MKRNKRWILILLLFCIAALFLNSVFLSKANYTIQSDKIPSSFDNFKIVQLSDLHNSRFGKDHETTVNLLKEEQPDLIVLTGDLMDSRYAEYDNTLCLIEQIKDLAPILFITGNHEGWDRTQAEKMEAQLNALSVVSLHNTCTAFTREAQSISICGLDAPDWISKEGASYDPDRIVEAGLQDLPETEGFTILLAHHPEFFPLYAQHEFDLVLGGHTHGGQVRIPVLGAPFAPDQGFFPKYSLGSYSIGNSTMIVSSGLGNSLVPIRFNDPPQIVCITLKKG